MPQCAAHSLSVNVNNGMVTENCNVNFAKRKSSCVSGAAAAVDVATLQQCCRNPAKACCDDDDVFLSFAFFRTIFSHRVAMANCEKRFFGRARSSGKMVQKRRCENCCKAEISGCVAEVFFLNFDEFKSFGQA